MGKQARGREAAMGRFRTHETEIFSGEVPKVVARYGLPRSLIMKYKVIKIDCYVFEKEMSFPTPDASFAFAS